MKKPSLRSAHRMLALIACIQLLLLITSAPLRAQTAQEIVQALNAQLHAGEGVRAKFHTKTEGTITILAQLHGGGARITNSDGVVITDGKTYWNYSNAENAVFIDNPRHGSSSTRDDVAAVLDLDAGYSAELTEQQGSRYFLTLTPNQRTREALVLLGSIDSLTLVVLQTKKGYRIVSASLYSDAGTTAVSSISISSVKTVSTSDFTFKIPHGAKVTDLRE